VSDPAEAARHAEALATARAFGRASGAERVVLLLDEGETAPPAMIEWEAGDRLRVTQGETAHELTGAAAGGRPKDLPAVRAIPAGTLDIDLEIGRLEAPIGAIDHLAESVAALAAAFGGRSVATADFPTRREDQRLTIAARIGEPAILAVGEESFELPRSA
jgi:hypothetical protein